MKKKIHRLLKFSAAEMEQQYRSGFVSQLDYDVYLRVWIWLNVRCSSYVNAENTQILFIRKYGRKAYHRKINRTREAFGFEPLVWEEWTA